MKRNKIPFPVFISIFVLFLVPTLGYIFTSITYFIPFWKIHKILKLYTYPQIFLNFALILIGFGMLFLKRWAFISFLFVSFSFSLYCLFLIVSPIVSVNVWKFEIFDYTVLTFLFALCILLLAFMVKREMSMPYFSVVGRGWRMSRRENIPIPYQWKNDLGEFGSGVAENISANGCLLPITERQFAILYIGDFLECNFYIDVGSESRIIQIFGEIVRFREPGQRTPAAIGVRFHSQKYSKEKVLLEKYVEKNYAPRFAIDSEILNLDLESQKEMLSSGDSSRLSGSSFAKAVRSFQGYNLSESGLYLISEILPSPGDSLCLHIPSPLGKILLLGEVVWTNQNAKYQKPKGFGFKIILVKHEIRFRLYLLLLAYLDNVRR